MNYSSKLRLVRIRQPDASGIMVREGLAPHWLTSRPVDKSCGAKEVEEKRGCYNG